MTITKRGIRKGQPNRYLAGHGRRGKVVPGKCVEKMPEYAAFHHARDRCNDPGDIGYKNYGGRGIEFRFTSFQLWYEELGPRPSKAYSVDRINNDGHYEPGNLRWATRDVQLRNRRKHKPGPKPRGDDRPKWLIMLEGDRMAKERILEATSNHHEKQ